MQRLKLLCFTLFKIGPKTFFNQLKRSIYEEKTVCHYKLPVKDVRKFPTKEKFEHKIFYNFGELPQNVKEKVETTLGREKLKIFRERLNYSSEIVCTFLNGEFVSYCFFAYSREQFAFFTLPKGEIYFYDCFTFPEYRGKSAVYSEVKYVLDVFDKGKYEYANVEIEKWNTASQKAFAKLGFYKTKEFYLKRILFFERKVKL